MTGIKSVIFLMIWLLKDNTGEIKIKIGNTEYIVNEIFAEEGRTLSEAKEHLMLYAIQKEEAEKKRSEIYSDKELS